MRIMIFIILLLVISVDIISATGSCQSFQISSDHLNKKLTNHSLGELTVLGHHQCAQECMSLKGCKSIDFYKKENYCKLNDVDSTAVVKTEFEHKSGFVFTDISELPSEMLGNCVSRPCSIKQKCFSSLETYSCVDIECSTSELDITNGKLVLDTEGEHYFRDTATVNCNQGYLSDVTRVSCTLQGKWEEVECKDTSIAVGKIAQSSSIFKSYAPENGIDGSIANFFQTETEPDAWWRVDLGFVFEIHNVNIYNRADCCQERANGLELEVGITLDKMVQISKIETFTEILKTIYPPAGTEARFVSLTLRTGQPLHLAEVEVQGEPGEDNIVIVRQPACSAVIRFTYKEGHCASGDISKDVSYFENDLRFQFEMNVAFGKTAQSSTTHYTFVPGNGIDGHKGNFFHTEAEAVAWWRVDLALLFEIVNVSIYNRENCCQENANGLELEVGKTLDSMVLISKIETFTVLLKTIYPPAGTEARYVSLTLRTGNPLHLAEVEVQGKPANLIESQERLLRSPVLNISTTIPRGQFYPNVTSAIDGTGVL